MALVPYSKVFGIKEARVSLMLTDPTGVPPATYAASVVVQGSQQLAIAGTIDSKWLTGDNTVLDADAVWTQLTATLDYAKLGLDALAVMFSTAIVNSGTTPNQLATWAPKSSDTLSYFKIEARSASADPVAGDVHFILYKCKLSAFPTLGLAEMDYKRTSLSVNCLPRLADKSWMLTELRETAATLT